MKRTSIYEYYAFGFNYGLIKQSGLFEHEKLDAIDTLEGFFEKLESLDLQVSLKVATELKKILKKLKESEDEYISEELSEVIKEEIKKIDPALDAELQLREAYVLEEKRYSLNKLIKTPNKLLSSGVYDNLSDTAKRDFVSACVQIALSQPTASAFHLMRTLEEQVKMLYFGFKKTKRLEKPMWGPMTSELKKKRSPKPSDKLLDHLDSMRVHFRNPTQHPELFYTLDEAQDLLNQTITAVNMIHAELPNKS